MLQKMAHKDMIDTLLLDWQIEDISMQKLYI